MKNYFNNLNDELKEYFKILSPEIPEWLEDYIDVPEMERISKISMFCGKDYSKLYGVKYFISNLFLYASTCTELRIALCLPIETWNPLFFPTPI